MESECQLIIENLLPELEQLSKQKYGSNVLEKVCTNNNYKCKSSLIT